MNIDWLRTEIATAIDEFRREWAGHSVPAQDVSEVIAEAVKRRLIREMNAYEKRIKKIVDDAFEKEREVVP